MKHEQYTCDRCGEKMEKYPKAHGDWAFSIGLLCVMRHSAGSGHLCDRCFEQVKTLTDAFWLALFPRLKPTAR